MGRILIRLISLALLAALLYGCNEITPQHDDQSESSDNPATTGQEEVKHMDFELDSYDLSLVKKVNGGWNVSNGALSIMNKDSGNAFAMTDICAQKNSYMYFEADVNMTEGGAVGLVFGVPNQMNPASAWYCVNIDKKSSNTRLFSVNIGTIGTNSTAQRGLYPAEKSKTKFNMVIEAFPSNEFFIYIDGVLSSVAKDDTFAGGYLGFNSWYSNVEISNVKYKIVQFEQGIASLTLNGAELDRQFSSGEYYYKAAAGSLAESAALALSATSGYDLYVDGDFVTSGSKTANVSLAPGENEIKILAVNKETGVQSQTKLIVTREVSNDKKYSDTYRSQYHFSTYKNFINDPNGLVYNEVTGEYHMYYQYNPYTLTMGNQVWGHAVSADLIHWKEVGVAIEGDPLGRIYSGSAVIDYNNTSGFFDETTPPGARMVAVYSYSTNKQAVAYSKDNGYTWTKYSGNPVIGSSIYGSAFRDPKVIWVEDKAQRSGGIWLMIVAGGRAQIYTSPDLKNWTLNSALTYKDGTPIESECPDFFPLAADGNQNKVKWVYTGAGKFYVVGDLVKGTDGKYSFVATQDKMTNYNGGPSVYATQSYFNDKSGRRILVSWLKDSSSFQLAGKGWNGLQSLPFETTLKTVNGKLQLVSTPVSEIKSLYSSTPLFTAAGKTVNSSDENILAGINSKTYVIEAVITPGTASEFGFMLRKGEKEMTAVKYNRSGSAGAVSVNTMSSGSITGAVSNMAVYPAGDGKIRLTVYVDTCVINAVANDGEGVVTALYFSSADSLGMSFYTSGGSVYVDSINIYEMKSIW